MLADIAQNLQAPLIVQMITKDTQHPALCIFKIIDPRLHIRELGAQMRGRRSSNGVDIALRNLMRAK